MNSFMVSIRKLLTKIESIIDSCRIIVTMLHGRVRFNDTTCFQIVTQGMTFQNGDSYAACDYSVWRYPPKKFKLSQNDLGQE